MVRRCGCDPVCSCGFKGGNYVTITELPGGELVVSIVPGSTWVTVADSTSIDFTITGTGVPADPYVISASRIVGAPDPAVAFNRQQFTTDGTWTKPFTNGWAEIWCWGGGGGGGGANSKPIRPGNGGGGGGLSRRVVLLDDLPDEVDVIVGVGGAGGAGAPDGGSPGAGGAAGTRSIFGSIVYAQGGRGGTRSGNSLDEAPDGGHGTEPGGRGGLPFFDYNVRDFTDPAYQAVGLASSGGGAGGYPSSKGPAQAQGHWWDGANGGVVVGGGFVLYGVGGDWQSESSPSPGTAAGTGGTVGSTGGGGGHGGGDGPGEHNRTRQNGAAGGDDGGGGGGGGGAGGNSGGRGGPGGSGKIIVNCWQGTTP